MKTLSLNRAAKEASVAKSTLLKALEKGRMSAAKNDKGHWEIEPSELFRVFPKTTIEPETEPVLKPEQATSQNDSKTSVLEAKLEMMEKRFEDAQETIGDLRTRLDSAETERKETQRMLTHMTGQTSEKPKGLWKRVFG